MFRGGYPVWVHEDFDRCYRAVQSNDARFDGWFVTAVATTRIYCRPSCPARSPLADGVIELDAGADRERARHQLAELTGVGPWTLGVIAMRALGDPDALPATDMGVVKGAAALGLPTTPATLIARSWRWRPWRSYAVQYLWATQDHPVNRWIEEESPCT